MGIEHFQKYGVTWRGFICNLNWREGDETIAPHVLLFIGNRKGLHYVVLEQEKVNLTSLESLEVGPFRPEQKITILEYHGKIIQVLDGHEEDGQILFQSFPGERPWGYRLKHSILDPICAWHECLEWEHWYTMSPAARKAFLAENRGLNWYLDGWGHEVWHPAYISAGFPYWEYRAEQPIV